MLSPSIACVAFNFPFNTSAFVAYPGNPSTRIGRRLVSLFPLLVEEKEEDEDEEENEDEDDDEEEREVEVNDIAGKTDELALERKLRTVGKQ